LKKQKKLFKNINLNFIIITILNYILVMNRDIRIDAFEPIDFRKGVPSDFSMYALSQAISYHAKGPWGVICIQEIRTEKYLLRHFLFSLEKAISFYIQERNEGLQSLISLKGEFYHSINGLKRFLLKEKEYILFNAGTEETVTTVQGGKISSILNPYFAPDSYKNLLPFFPGFKKDLKKTTKKARHFNFPPRLARYTVHDAIHAIWFDRYIKNLQLKHVEIRLQACLFTLLAQTYSPVNAEPVTSLESEKAAAARDIILRDIKVHLSPQQISMELHCSSAWIKKAFGKMYGIGIFHFLRKTRMERAKEMLLRGESLKAVAIEVGMKPSNFPKEFKAFFGYTVTALKKGRI
jgi:AraC-like DNA-binding protein